MEGIPGRLPPKTVSIMMMTQCVSACVRSDSCNHTCQVLFKLLRCNDSSTVTVKYPDMAPLQRELLALLWQIIVELQAAICLSVSPHFLHPLFSQMTLNCLSFLAEDYCLMVMLSSSQNCRIITRETVLYLISSSHPSLLDVPSTLSSFFQPQSSS